MIEEKNIYRLDERDEALKMGFELVLIKNINYENKWNERIKIGNYFVEGWKTESFLKDDIFGKLLIADYATTPWFDIQKPKMRQMNLAEIDAYLHKKGRSLCEKYSSGDIVFNQTILRANFELEYPNFGTLNPDNIFEPLPLVPEC